MQIKKCFDFEASHQLEFHDGKCSRLHGHSWEFDVVLEGSRNLSEQNSTYGMVEDFSRVKSCVQGLISEYLDHHHLNETLPCYPTSENIAVWLYQKIRKRFEKYEIGADKLEGVILRETCTSEVRYYGG